MTALLITGTDTEVGKTLLTTALIAYWQQHLDPAALGVMKLMQAGEGDGELYQRLFDFAQLPETLVPLKFQAPIAPPLAAEQEGRTVNLAVVWQAYAQLQAAHKQVIVEGVGGLGSPVTRELTVADLGAMWRLRAVLVVPIRLGAIGQAVANVALARQVKLPLGGLVLNCPEPLTPEQQANWAPVDLLRNLTQLPILGTLPYLGEHDRYNKAVLIQVAAGLDLAQLGIPAPRLASA
ncbi:MAG: dethiobiotin synthase [Cyanobacteria bacterium P01_G01_bin.54]